MRNNAGLSSRIDTARNVHVVTWKGVRVQLDAISILVGDQYERGACLGHIMALTDSNM